MYYYIMNTTHKTSAQLKPLFAKVRLSGGDPVKFAIELIERGERKALVNKAYWATK